MVNDIVLSCGGLYKIFKTEAEELQILKGVELGVQRGACASITGPSGCGKSTLLSILGGLDKPSSGWVRMADRDIVGANEDELSLFRARQVGFVFQAHYLLKDFTALENTMLPAYMLGGNRRKAEEKARELLDAVGLSERMGHTPSRLSGGERQRVAIARALVNDPLVVLADEPTGSLDEANARTVEELLFSVVERRGASLVLVTHDPRLAARADYRYQLCEGQITAL